MHLCNFVSNSRGLVAAYSKNSTINSYVYITYRDDKPGIVGIAYLGTTCRTNVNLRSSLNEYQGGDLNTALVRGSHPNCFTHTLNFFDSHHNDN